MRLNKRGNEKQVGRWPVVGLFVLCFLVCVGMVVYPLAANLIYEQRQDTIITDYQAEVGAATEGLLAAERTAAAAYNDALRAGVTVAEEYEARLNLAGNGIMGYLEIPKIQVQLPVYHGATEAVLDKGLGHVPQTSLPVGGAGTHAGITGHTGVADRKLFSDLDQMEAGDWFFVHVLGETLAYEVAEILVVWPWETEHLDPIEGADCVTLITCTPYGINDHRLLVRGVRRELAEAPGGDMQPGESGDLGTSGSSGMMGASSAVASTWLRRYLTAVGCGVALFLALLGAYFWWYRCRRRRPRREVLMRVGRKRRQARLARLRARWRKARETN